MINAVTDILWAVNNAVGITSTHETASLGQHAMYQVEHVLKEATDKDESCSIVADHLLLFNAQTFSDSTDLMLHRWTWTPLLHRLFSALLQTSSPYLWHMITCRLHFGKVPIQSTNERRKLLHFFFQPTTNVRVLLRPHVKC